MQEWLETALADAGVHQYGEIDTAKVVFHDVVRTICEGNSCQQYGASWACPPAVGTLEECRQRCLQYSTMLLFSGLYRLEDSFDYEGMMEGMAAFKALAHQLDDSVRPHLARYQILANEGCGICKVCTYPDAPCRFPERLHHSIEGYGIMVNDVARQAGINYTGGPNTVTYFGALLY